MSTLSPQMNWAFGVVAQLDTTAVEDAGSTRTVLAIAAILLLAAVALSVITVWYWKNTVPDPEALASLSEMTERRARSWWRVGRRAQSE